MRAVPLPWRSGLSLRILHQSEQPPTLLERRSLSSASSSFSCLSSFLLPVLLTQTTDRRTLIFNRQPMDLFEEIVRMRRAGQRGALATIVHTNGSIPSYESSRMLVREDGSIVGTVGGGCVEADVWAAAKEALRTRAPRKMVFHLNNEASYDNGLICGGTLEIFVEPILPQPLLYLFGGGHVSMAVAKAAGAAGFGIGVVDDREAFANKERFPMAQEIYSSYEEAFEKLHPNAASY